MEVISNKILFIPLTSSPFKYLTTSLANKSNPPLALFPLLGVYDFSDASNPAKSAFTKVAAPYAHPNVFLFLGGFILALAIEKVNLHKRIALKMLLSIGTDAP